jgi:hypothetical protein
LIPINAAVSYTYGIIQTSFSLLLEKAMGVLFTGTFMFTGAYEITRCGKITI